MLVVGDVPSEIRVPREQYLQVLSRLEAGVHRSCPHESELAYDLIEMVRHWIIPPGNPGSEHHEHLDQQLELPLEWPERAAR